MDMESELRKFTPMVAAVLVLWKSLHDSNSNFHFPFKEGANMGHQIAISKYSPRNFTARYGKTLPWPSLTLHDAFFSSNMGTSRFRSSILLPSFQHFCSLVVRRNKSKAEFEGISRSWTYRYVACSHWVLRPKRSRLMPLGSVSGGERWSFH